jgi:hypothetical protein
MEAIQYIPRDDLDFRIEVLKAIHRIIKSHKATKDMFKEVGGFVTIVSMIVGLEDAFEQADQASLNKMVMVLQMVFTVLVEAMRHHEVNKTSFKKDVGYGTLENALVLSGALARQDAARHVFSMLFSFALEDESMNDLFVENDATDTVMTTTFLRSIESKLGDLSTIVVSNSDITPTILNLEHLISNSSGFEELSHGIFYALMLISKSTRGNQIKLNGSGLILTLLQRAFDRGVILQTVQNLMNMGIGFKELEYMFRGLDTTDNITLENTHGEGLLELLLQGASRSRWPNFLQFDMRENPRTSLEVPELPHFPPSNPGYTISLWFHIEKKDDTSYLSLFSLFNEHQLVYKIYIDPKTSMLQVYNIQSKQDARFKSFQFRVGFWYHLTLVHYKSRLSAKSSTMAMFINGSKVEQVTCTYVPQPPSKPFKAVMGTLDNTDLLIDISEKSQFIWSLGPFYLIQDTLEEEKIALYFSLGARYKSLFQGALRQCQTYEASTSLYLSLYKMTKGRRDPKQYSLAYLMRGAAFQTLPESKIMLAFFACNALEAGQQTGSLRTGMGSGVLATVEMEISRSRMVLNSAIPKMADAVYSPSSMGYLVGDPIVAYPFGLDESVWKVGGCAIALKLVERAEVSFLIYFILSLSHPFYNRLKKH